MPEVFAVNTVLVEPAHIYRSGSDRGLQHAETGRLTLLSTMKFGKLIGRAEELLPDLKHLCIRYKELKKYVKNLRPGNIDSVPISGFYRSRCRTSSEM